MTIREHMILYAGALLLVICAASPAFAQPCQPYDVAIKNLAEGGWVVHPDIVLGDAYEADRLIVGSLDGFAFALPVVNGCVVPVQPIPLGSVKDKGEPA